MPSFGPVLREMERAIERVGIESVDDMVSDARAMMRAHDAELWGEDEWRSVERHVAHREATCGHGSPAETIGPVTTLTNDTLPTETFVCPHCRLVVWIALLVAAVHAGALLDHIEQMRKLTAPRTPQEERDDG